MAKIETLDIHNEHDAVVLLVTIEAQIKAARNLWQQCNHTTLTQDVNTRYLILTELEDAGIALNGMKAQVVDRLERMSFPFTITRI